MGWPGIIGLGEMMNFPGVINGDPQMLAEMAETMRAGKTVGGHYASPDLGTPFHAYAAGGAAEAPRGQPFSPARGGASADGAPGAKPSSATARALPPAREPEAFVTSFSWCASLLQSRTPLAAYTRAALCFVPRVLGEPFPLPGAPGSSQEQRPHALAVTVLGAGLARMPSTCWRWL